MIQDVFLKTLCKDFYYFFQKSTETKLHALKNERKPNLSKALLTCEESVLNIGSKFVTNNWHCDTELLLHPIFSHHADAYLSRGGTL